MVELLEQRTVFSATLLAHTVPVVATGVGTTDTNNHPVSNQAADGDGPTEQIKFPYGTLVVKYTTQSADGTAK